jgi:predicted nucleic acid-binding protein
VSPVVLLDTGPLVAFLRRRDRYHQWAVEQFSRIPAPMHTCEAVLTEACYLLQSLPGGSQSVLRMLETGALRTALHVEDELTPIKTLMARYRNVSMSLADACLVRMSELNAAGVVLTLDSDFIVYRRHGRQVIPVIIPKESASR